MPARRLPYEKGGQRAEGSYGSPQLNAGRQELAYDSQRRGPPVTGETGPVMGGQDGRGLKPYKKGTEGPGVLRSWEEESKERPSDCL